jgi:hypothetical protein
VLNAIDTCAFLEVRKLVLGEKLWEEKGKIMGFSIKSAGPEGQHMEQSFTSVCKGFGRFPNGTNVGTMDVVMAPDGGYSGSGQGIATSQDGDVLTWKIYFFGKMEAQKGRSFGIISFRTASQKLAWINKTVVAMEGTVDAKTMELSTIGYEWK